MTDCRDCKDYRDSVAFDGYVYFFYAREVNRVKIGKAINWRTRLAQIQSSSPVYLRCVYLDFLIPENGHNVTMLEREFQERFKQYRLWGEWFEVKGELAEFLKPYILGKAKVREL